MSSLSPQIEFYDAPDGRRLAARVWRRAEQTRGRVVFVHGITSHSGWYHRSCRHLAANGFEVHFLDRRGSGLNCDAPGDVEQWQTWVDDVAEYVRGCQVSGVRCQGNQSPVLCGISWGGKLATAVARQHPELIGGLGLICPGLFSHQEAGVFKRAALKLLPRRLAKQRVDIPLGDPTLFIDSRQSQAFVATDPLSLRQITIRFAQEDVALTRYARASASHLHLPMLLMLAGRDRIVDNWRTRGFFTQTAGHRTLIEYPSATHTLEFELDPTQYFRDLANWIGMTLWAGGQECC